MGMAGRRHVIAQFTDNLMAQRYSELYEQLMADYET
jgi:hypothetical protein